MYMKMTYKKKKYLLFTVYLFVFLISLVLIMLIDNSYICTTSHVYENKSEILDVFCSRYFGEGFLLPVWLFSGVALISSFILIFLKEQVFNSWKKFAIPFIVFSAIWITFAPANCSGGWAGFGGCTFSKEIVAWFTSGIFLIISILIIIYKSSFLCNQGKKES